MPRYLVDVVATIEVECDTVDDIDDTVRDFVNAYFPDEIVGWRVEDSFTVIAP